MFKKNLEDIHFHFLFYNVEKINIELIKLLKTNYLKQFEITSFNYIGCGCNYTYIFNR
jgi:hypothetical protein